MSKHSDHLELSLDDLIIDPRIQRHEGIDQRRINKMAANFNPLALGVITVSPRPGKKFAVLDGAHRTAGARQAGYTERVSAHVVWGMTLEEEASLFLLLNETKTPSALTKFLVRAVTGEPEAVEMLAIITAHGWKVRTASEPGNIAAVAAIESVYRNGGGSLPEGRHADLLDRVLGIITEAWEYDSQSVSASMLKAVAQLLGRFGPSVDTKKIVAEMQATRPTVMVGRARVLCNAQGGNVASALAKILAGLHNKKRRANLLPEWVWIR